MAKKTALWLGLWLALGASAEELQVATAANFRSTLLEIAARFESRSGHSLSISSAATGVLYTQVRNGAPFDILLAADAEHPELLERSGHAVKGGSVTYAYGLLVAVYRPGLEPQATRGIAALLGTPHLNIAIANPLHAPYGRAAELVLAQAPLAPSSRLLRAANVGQAYQMWHAGGADVALVAASFTPEQFVAVPRAWYRPLQQRAALLSRARDKAAAGQFLAFLVSAPIQALIESRGYLRGAPNNG